MNRISLSDSIGQNKPTSNVTAAASTSSLSKGAELLPKKKIILKRKPFVYENSNQDETDAKKSKQINS